VAYLAYSEVIDSVFVLNIPYIKFGMGASKEVGYEARRLGIISALLVQRDVAIIALHVWICAMLKQELYNVEMTTRRRTV
jgi:hypothetical protein